MNKKWIAVAVFLLIVMVLAMVLSEMLSSKEEKEKEKEPAVESEITEEEMETPEEVAEEFLTIIYEYDTAERMFFEGADKMMTKEAYEKLIPMPSEEIVEEYFHMKSELDRFLLYKREMSANEMEILAEVYFSISGSGDYTQRQIVRLYMEFANKHWLITDCSVLNTEGE